LKTCDQGAEIYISIDEEGNDFKPIYEICIASGEKIYSRDLSTPGMGTLKGYIIYPEG